MFNLNKLKPSAMKEARNLRKKVENSVENRMDAPTLSPRVQVAVERFHKIVDRETKNIIKNKETWEKRKQAGTETDRLGERLDKNDQSMERIANKRIQEEVASLENDMTPQEHMEFEAAVKANFKAADKGGFDTVGEFQDGHEQEKHDTWLKNFSLDNYFGIEEIMGKDNMGHMSKERSGVPKGKKAEEEARELSRVRRELADEAKKDLLEDA